MEDFYVWPDGEVWDRPVEWKSDDYVCINDKTTLGDILELDLQMQYAVVENFKSMVE